MTDTQEGDTAKDQPETQEVDAAETAIAQEAVVDDTAPEAAVVASRRKLTSQQKTIALILGVLLFMLLLFFILEWLKPEPPQAGQPLLVDPIEQPIELPFYCCLNLIWCVLIVTVRL